MKVLLDHCVPRRLAADLAGHEVSTTRDMEWEEEQNGELMKRAADAGFDAILTVDARFAHDQFRGQLPIAVLVVRAVSNDVDDIRRLMPQILTALESIKKSAYSVVEGRTRRGGKL